MSTSDGSAAEYTGKDVSYYLVRIASPKRLEPYDAECEDIIEALGMTFAEGCAFKAIWRKCAARTLGIAKAGYKGGLYDAEKAEYYGARMVAAELRAATIKESLTVRPAHIDPADVEIASAIDDDSERMQAIGQNGNGGEHYGAPDWSKAPDNAVLYIDWTESAAGFESAFYCDGGDRFYRLPLRTGTPVYVLKLENGFPDIDYPYFMRPAK